MKSNDRWFAYSKKLCDFFCAQRTSSLAGVSKWLVFSLCGVSQRGKFFCRLKCVIRFAAGDQKVKILSIGIEPLCLKVWTTISAAATFKDWSFVPINAKPQQIFDKTNTRSVARSLLIGVFNAQHEGAAPALGKCPTEKRSSRSSNMKIARWTWCKARDDFV